MSALKQKRDQIWQETESQGVLLCAVTKGHSLSELKTLLQDLPDLRAIAENRWPDCEEKFLYLEANHPQIERHFIGPIQSNKIRKIVPLVDTIQSIEKIKHLKKINQVATELSKKINFFIQINISHDSHKSGLSPKALPNFLAELQKQQAAGNLKNVNLQGLMTIGRQAPDQEVLNYFQSMHNLFIQTKSELPKNNNLKHLSMGMTQDYPLALQAKTTLVRIGSGLF